MIRPATAADAADLAQLRYEFRASFGTVEESRVEFLLRCERWIRDTLGTGDRWCAWIAILEGAAAGTIWLQWIEKIPNPVAESEWHGYITSLFVREGFRGQSLGSALLETALDTCRSKGVDAVILWPTPRSRSLYSRHGFTASNDIMQLR